jgi:UDP-2,4-diacetamido-2,4,6-trideoxy-beta-L-altropyranose hydrolase
MKVAIRVDASSAMGSGHLIRCRTLAAKLKQAGAEVVFMCREHHGNLNKFLENEGFEVRSLVLPSVTAATSDSYAAWLGVSQITDAQETIQGLRGYRPDLLIVDHYALNTEWHKQLRPFIGRLMVIDDLFNRSHDCDFLLDQNLTACEKNYETLVSARCQRLLGTDYALLSDEYSKLRQQGDACSGQLNKVLIYFGGVDPDNLSGMALKALSEDNLKEVEVSLVIGANNPPYKHELLQQAQQRPNTVVLEPQKSLSELMFDTDLMIGAGGATSWERLCLGVPSVIVTLAENQQYISSTLDKFGLAVHLGSSEQVTEKDFFSAVDELAQQPEKLVSMSAAGRGLVDGQGCARVVDVLVEACA